MKNRKASIRLILSEVPDHVVQMLMIGRTAGGGMLEILRIEVNTCES